jgi:hypothetical protein
MLSINMPLEGKRFMTYHDFGCIDEFEPHNAQMILAYRGNLYTNLDMIQIESDIGWGLRQPRSCQATAV